MKRIFILVTIVIAALIAGWFALGQDDLSYETLEAKYAHNASNFLTLETGLIVHYRDEGPENAPVLVLLHGFSASVHTWEDWARALRQDYRVISFDLPGHGLTRALPDEDHTLEGLVRFVSDVTEALALDDFVLIGSSMGGNTAWRFALEHEDQMRGLVLVAASGLPPETETDTPFIFKLIENPVIGPLMTELDLTPLIKDGVRKSFFDPERFVTDEMVTRYSELSRAPGHRDALLSLATRAETDPTISDGLKQLSLPTLILFGDTDNLVPSSDGARFQALIPGSELIMYENTGHLPQEERAQASLADLTAFLQSLDSGAK